ncbi:MAG: phosphoribosyl-AMP cyclohydrolase [Candidatus Symbiobacter sp.]|nr:phosphoribosyl-AMP cyclohydrolase [Candidatus Symbiobacter sp.]
MPSSPRQFSRSDAAALARQVQFGENGLVTAIAQDATSHEILMLAWMNLDALVQTLTTGRVCYWSRSRQKLWQKGEESGQYQYLRDIFLDCDGDAVLMRVDQVGVACHTGRKNCFFRQAQADSWQEIIPPLIDPASLYRKK